MGWGVIVQKLGRMESLAMDEPYLQRLNADYALKAQILMEGKPLITKES